MCFIALEPVKDTDGKDQQQQNNLFAYISKIERAFKLVYKITVCLKILEHKCNIKQKQKCFISFFETVIVSQNSQLCD